MSVLIIDSTKLNLIFLQDFVDLNIVTLEATEVLPVYLFGVGENVLSKQLQQGLRRGDADFRLAV